MDVGIIKPKKSIFTDLDNEVDQIWAEAYELYKKGEHLYLEGEVADLAIEHQEKHLEINPKEGVIREFVSRQVIEGFNEWTIEQRKIFWANDKSTFQGKLIDRDRICAAEVWVECLGADLKMMKRADAMEINNILCGIEGWQKSDKAMRFGTSYGPQKGFIREEIAEKESYG